MSIPRTTRIAIAHGDDGSPFYTLEPLTTAPAPEATPAAPTSPLAPSARVTVKRVDIFGNVTDTFQTEAELNGIRPKQGALF